MMGFSVLFSQFLVRITIKEEVENVLLEDVNPSVYVCVYEGFFLEPGYSVTEDFQNAVRTSHLHCKNYSPILQGGEAPWYPVLNEESPRTSQR